MAGRHHRQGAGSGAHFRQGDPAVAAEFRSDLPVERVLVEIAAAPLHFDDLRVLDPYLVGIAFHGSAQQGGHGLHQARMVGDPGEDLLLAGGLLNTARQRTAPGRLVSSRIEHLEVPCRPVGQARGQLHGSPARGLDQIGRNQSLNEAPAVLPVLPQVRLGRGGGHLRPPSSCGRRRSCGRCLDGTARGSTNRGRTPHPDPPRRGGRASAPACRGAERTGSPLPRSRRSHAAR